MVVLVGVAWSEIIVGFCDMCVRLAGKLLEVVLEAYKNFLDVAWHGEVNTSPGVVPVQCEAC